MAFFFSNVVLMFSIYFVDVNFDLRKMFNFAIYKNTR